MVNKKKLFIALFMALIMVISAFSMISQPSNNGVVQNLSGSPSGVQKSKEINNNLALANLTSTRNSLITTDEKSIIGSHVPEAIALSSDSMGNLFVLWNNGNVFERPDMGGSNWIYLGNAEAVGSYNNGTINLGVPVGIRASYNWENERGQTTGMIMVLFSNGFASMASYGTDPIVWTLTNLSGKNYVSLSYNLDDYSYLGGHTQVFYATQKNGITYGYSDKLYSWSPIIGNSVSHNITATLAWSNNFSPPSTGTVILLAISRNGYVFFAEGSTNPLQPLSWVAEGKITATDPDFTGLTQTPNPSSCFYYYAIEGQKNSQLFASAAFNGTASSFNPVGNTTTQSNQTAIQNKYFGYNEGSDELILLQNGQIYQTKDEGSSYTLFAKVPINETVRNSVNVMPWIYQSSNLQASLQELRETRGNYSMISYEFYELQPDEQITPFSGYTNSSNPNNITPILHRYGIGAVPMIVSASGKLIYLFTSNQYVMSLAINQMAEYAVIYNYTGYDIDWEPSSTNKTTGLQFDNFINQFSLVLNKFGKKLYVEVASWDPNFWNYTNMGRTNITSINIMDYDGYYSGSNSFTSCLQEGLNLIPSGKLSISLENVNPNTCLNFTASQLRERFAALENDNIKFIGVWVMPFNTSLVSQLEDFISNSTHSNYSSSFSPGSSGIQVKTTGNAISGTISYRVYKGDYIDGNSSFKTNFAEGTSISTIFYNYTGSASILILVEESDNWILLKEISETINGKIILPSGTTNIEFLYGNFTGEYTDQSRSAVFSYKLDFITIANYGWVNVYYQEGASLSVNGQPPHIVSVEKYGQWDIANISLISGNYNISIEKYEFLGYFDNVQVIQGHDISVYANIETLLGKVTGRINPENATLTINGKTEETQNGQFSFCNIQGDYTIDVQMNFYHNFSKTLSIERGKTVTLNINLTFLPPLPVKLKLAKNITGPSFEITWTQFNGLDFQSYQVYLSTDNSSQGTLIYSTNTINDTSYTFVNLSYSTTYYATIVVKAQNGVSNSQKIIFKTTSAGNSIAAKDRMLSYYSYAIIALAIISILSLGAVIFLRFKKH